MANENDNTNTSTNTPPAYMESIRNLIRGHAGDIIDAQRQEYAGFQRIAALIMHMAEHKDKVPYTVKTKKETKPATYDFNWNALVACDDSTRKPGEPSGKMFRALTAFVEGAMGADAQRAGDIVSFTARMALVGYTLEHFNGVYTVSESGMLEYADKGEFERGVTPQHMQPGMFRVKPMHVAYGKNADGVLDYYEDAALGRLKPAKSNGGDTFITVLNEKVQELCIDNKVQHFLVGKTDDHGERTPISIRIGRNTFMNATTEMRKRHAAQAELAAENARKQAYREQAEKRAETDKAYDPAKDPQHPDYKGSNGEDRGTGEGEKASTAPQTQVSKPQSAPSGQGQTQPQTDGKQPTAQPQAQSQERRVNEGQTRGQEDKDAKATRMEDVHTLVRGYFAPDKIKNDKATLKQAQLIFVTLLGAFKSLGMTDFLADPVKNINEPVVFHKPVTSKTNPAVARGGKR